MRWTIVLATALAFGLGACGQKSATEPPKSEEQIRLIASIKDLMDSEVDPSADALWDSVGSTTTAAGTDERQPRTDAEWAQARHYAITLAEAPNLLVMKGRTVAGTNGKLDDLGTPGILSPPEIQKKIDSDRPLFARYARELQKAALQALAAIDTKNPGSLVTAGGEIDEACESCHLHYWYPNSPRPKEGAGKP